MWMDHIDHKHEGRTNWLWGVVSAISPCRITHTFPSTHHTKSQSTHELNGDERYLQNMLLHYIHHE